MDKAEKITYWLEAAGLDFKSMQVFLANGENHWALFVGQLVLEKTLKALILKNTELQIPRTHNLVQLAETAGLKLNEVKSDLLDLITTYNISTRYPDERFEFYKKCTPEFTEEQSAIIEELYLWLRAQIEQK
ncbi:hypothetical protein MASR1M36_01980 [Candidatus Cloacimonadaceae bacterium]|jgi:HEPN domain-containing protein